MGTIRSLFATAALGSMCAVLPAPCLAADTAAADWRGQIGLGQLRFGYKEFADDGDLLDREDGLISGVAAGVSRRHGDWTFAVEGAYHAGDVTYDGQTNTGIPVRSRTDEDIVDLALRADRPGRTSGGRGYAFYGGIGYHFWGRDIRPTRTPAGQPVGGLFEAYTWWLGFVGGRIALIESSRSLWQVDLRLLRMVSAKIDVDFNGVYDDATLDLGERFGVRITFPWRYALDGRTDLVVEPYAEGWDIGRSATESLMRNGGVVGAVYEPRSETRNHGLTVAISQAF